MGLICSTLKKTFQILKDTSLKKREREINFHSFSDLYLDIGWNDGWEEAEEVTTNSSIEIEVI
jgi:hypothetical protein